MAFAVGVSPRPTALQADCRCGAARSQAMNTAHLSSPLRADSDPTESLHRGVDQFLAAVQAGVVTADLYTSDAALDATLPGWRFHRHGADAVRAEYAGWFTAPGGFEALERLAVC